MTGLFIAIDLYNFPIELLTFFYLLLFGSIEQIFQNIRQEYSRYQRRRQLEGAFNQSEACSSNDAQSSSPALTSPNSPTGSLLKSLIPTWVLKPIILTVQLHFG